jgi:hypothetical protein
VLTREQFLGSFERRVTPAPTTIGTFQIRNLSENEKTKADGALWKNDGSVDQKQIGARRRRYIVACLCDDAGQPLLREGDEKQLGGVDCAVLSAIWDKIVEVCGLGGDAAKDLEKNSDEAAAGDSPTG